VWVGARVYGWLAKYRDDGRDALKAKPAPGRVPKAVRCADASAVHADNRVRSPAAGTGFALWTRELVRMLIRHEFGVLPSAVSVGRLLRTLGCRRRAVGAAHGARVVDGSGPGSGRAPAQRGGAT
jgi:transposase